jgi:hypothetical protein
MSSFSDLMGDKVNLLKKDGNKFENIQASVQRNKIFTDANPKIPVEDGDVFERILPSGVIEKYLIIDAGYYSGFGGISANYQSQVQKQSVFQNQKENSKIVYNVSGNNASVNIKGASKYSLIKSIL